MPQGAGIGHTESTYYKVYKCTDNSIKTYTYTHAHILTHSHTLTHTHTHTRKARSYAYNYKISYVKIRAYYLKNKIRVLYAYYYIGH